MLFFKPKMVDKPCVQEQYIENIGQRKGLLGDSKKKKTLGGFHGGE